MECPVCGERLRTVEKYGVEFDICPDCKGIWLDRGKLETIISQAASGAGDLAQSTGATPHSHAPGFPHHDGDHDEHDGHDHDHREHDDDDHRYGQHRRRGSWLGDLLGGLGGDD